MENNYFAKGVEKLVNPINVGTLHFMQAFNNYVPKAIQKHMVASSGAVTPYMGFVVEPYSYFLCYEIEDIHEAQSYLPEGFRLCKTKIFEDDEAKYYGIFGCFNAHTSGFWGLRVEFYLIAEDISTGLLSWIIVDYDTNTITYDPKNALSDPNAVGSLMTTDYNGVITLDVVNNRGRKLAFTSDIKEGKMKALDNKLWVEGNLSVAYGKKKADPDSGVFSLIFNPGEFDQALKIPQSALELELNNWFPGLLKNTPSELVCFPYAQHFLSDSPGHSSKIEDEEMLNSVRNNIDFTKINVFSTDSFRKNMLIISGISAVINMLLVIALFKKKGK